MIDWYSDYDKINAELRRLAEQQNDGEQNERIQAHSGEDCLLGLLYPQSIKVITL